MEQLLALPGAVGFGRFATGGRGGRIIEVTNTNDSGAGSFRDAVKQSGARIVIFKVGGAFKLNYDDQIVITRGDLTILGETAPENSGGVTIQGSVRFSCTNFIVSNVRFALGDGNLSSGSSARDGLELTNAKNGYVRNCSIRWSIDENLALSGAENVTVEKCLVAEALYNSIHYQSAHSMGSFINKSKTVTFNQIIFISNRDRNTRTARSTYEIINCLYYGFRGQNTFSSGQKWSAIGCRWIKGTQELYNQFLFPYKVDSGWDDNPSAYIEDCTTEGFEPRLVDDRWAALFVDKANAFLSNTITPMPSTALEEELPKVAGCLYPKRDAVDVRVLNDLKNRTGRIIDSQNDVGGYLELEEGTQWVTPMDAETIVESGYSVIEEYAHEITGADGGTTEPEPTVVHVDRVELSTSPAIIKIGETYDFDEVVYPDNADDKTGYWISDGGTVDQNGVFTAEEEGTGEVTFVTNDRGRSATVEFLIEKEDEEVVHPRSVYLLPSNHSGVDGEVDDYNPVVTPAATSNKTGTWVSSDTDVATVDQNGTVTYGSEKGTCLITFKLNDGGKTATRQLTNLTTNPSDALVYTGTVVIDGVEREFETTVK